MKFKKNLLILGILAILLNSCNTLKEASKTIRNEKKEGSDEFLIKKKEPLTQPHDFEKIPEPDTLATNKEEENFEATFKKNKVEAVSPNSKKSSTESSILNRIKK